MKLALIPCGATEWHEQGRLLGRVDLPLSTGGRAEVSSWVGELRSQALTALLHADDELSSETARILADALKLRTKALPALAEVDLGLWTGLTVIELETRYESAYQGLCEAPLSIHPPGGEALADALARLKDCLRRQFRAGRIKPVGLILRPLAFALVRCYFLGRTFCEVFESALGTGRTEYFDITVPLPRNGG